VWVVYFSLAALPLFGLGQSLIPAGDLAQRRYTLWLMVCYVGSGLGLLLTTSFLGLRRYLRQRKLNMPRAMAGVWLVTGGVVIVGLLAGGAVLPRPHAEYPLVNVGKFGSAEREASEYAVRRDSAGKGKGSASSDPSRKDPNAQSGSGQQADRQSQQAGGKSSGSNSDARQQNNSNSQQGQQGSNQGKSESGQGNSQGKQASGQGKQGERGQNQSDQDKQNAGQDGEKNQPGSGKDKSNPNGSPGDKQQNARQEQSAGGAPPREKATASGENRSPSPARRPASPPGSASPSWPARLTGGLATVLKWVVFIVLALVVAFFVLRAVLQHFANFTDWARRLLDTLRAWWEGLFGGPGGRVESAEEAEAVDPRVRERPFASYPNPFHDGRADRLAPEQLVRYSFDALQAWAREHDLGRQVEETPREFAERVGDAFPALEADARRLASLYGLVAYTRGRLQSESAEPLRRFWQSLEQVGERVVSA
jgi:hypothetical protein